MNLDVQTRVRDNPVNLHMIAETHIAAYIEQEEESRMGLDNDSNILSSNDLEHIYVTLTS